MKFLFVPLIFFSCGLGLGHEDSWSVPEYYNQTKDVVQIQYFEDGVADELLTIDSGEAYQWEKWRKSHHPSLIISPTREFNYDSAIITSANSVRVHLRDSLDPIFDYGNYWQRRFEGDVEISSCKIDSVFLAN